MEKLNCKNLQQMLDEVGLRLPNHKVREIVQDIKNRGDSDEDCLDKAGFEKVGLHIDQNRLQHCT